jgi:hypothetical protein
LLVGVATHDLERVSGWSKLLSQLIWNSQVAGRKGRDMLMRLLRMIELLMMDILIL